jgi:hypothetical protein
MRKYILVVRGKKISCAQLELELGAKRHIAQSKLVPDSKGFLRDQDEEIKRAARTILNAYSDLKHFVIYKKAKQWHYSEAVIESENKKKKMVQLGEEKSFQVDADACNKPLHSVRMAAAPEKQNPKAEEDDLTDWHWVKAGENPEQKTEGRGCLCM